MGLVTELGRSFTTTNCLESINALIEQRTGKIDYSKNSGQKQRWLATALLDIDPRLRRVKAHRYLPALRRALQERRARTMKKAAYETCGATITEFQLRKGLTRGK